MSLCNSLHCMLHGCLSPNNCMDDSEDEPEQCQASALTSAGWHDCTLFYGHDGEHEWVLRNPQDGAPEAVA